MGFHDASHKSQQMTCHESQHHSGAKKSHILPLPLLKSDKSYCLIHFLDFDLELP